MPPQQNYHVDAIILSLQLLAVNHSVYFLFPRADHLPVCLSHSGRSRVINQSFCPLPLLHRSKPVSDSHRVQGRKVIILPLSGGGSND